MNTPPQIGPEFGGLAPASVGILCGTASGLPADELELKTLSTLRARAAMSGWVLEVHTSGCGGVHFTVSRWDKVVELPKVADVCRFLGAPAVDRGVALNVERGTHG